MSEPLGPRHRHVQRLRRLAGKRSVRDAERAFVLEGAKVIGEALAAGVVPEVVYAAHGHDDHPLLHHALDAGSRVRLLGPGVIEKVTDTVTPQPVVAVAAYTDVSLDDVSGSQGVVIAVDLRDPGNAGTVLRSAEAAGLDAVVFCTGSVDVFNPKCVRASAGSLFHVKVVRGGETTEVLRAVREAGLRCVGTVARGGEPYDRVDWQVPVALVLGNEAHGLPSGIHDHLDALVTIPLEGRAESLNVGMAAAVLSFERARQRRAAA